MTARILITGASGLIGTDLRPALEGLGHRVHGLDLVTGQDVREPLDLEAYDGVVHLAAMSRVAVAEANPEACWSTNVGGTENVLRAAEACLRRPWVLFASSREVYGQPAELPVGEDEPLRPLNVYGRAKVRGEELVSASSLVTGIVRLSNVYGRVTDHADRVVPAFARAAANGERVRVDGRQNGFDFTWIDDAIAGLLAMVQILDGGERLPPIQLVTGRETSLGELAELAVGLGASAAVEAPPRPYDVGRFCGVDHRARELLDWQASVSIEEGLSRLVQAFRSDAIHVDGTFATSTLRA